MTVIIVFMMGVYYTVVGASTRFMLCLITLTGGCFVHLESCGGTYLKEKAFF